MSAADHVVDTEKPVHDKPEHPEVDGQTPTKKVKTGNSLE